MVSIVLVGLLLGLIPNFTQLVFLSSENELMRSEKKEYGSFGTYVINCTDEDYKKLEAYPNVDRIKKLSNILCLLTMKNIITMIMPKSLIWI